MGIRRSPVTARSHFDMTGPVEAVVEIEGPIHIDLLVQRLRAGWGIGRVGSQIRANIDRAIRDAAVVKAGDFLDVVDRQHFPVRVPTGPDTTRVVAYVPDAELQNALKHLLHAAGGVSLDELRTGTARVFGWNRVGSDISERLTDVLRHMWKAKVIDYGDDHTVRLKAN